MDDSLENLSPGLLAKGRFWLLFNKPYYASIATAMKPIRVENVPDLPLVAVDKNLNLYYNPDGRASSSQVATLLEHEILHIMFSHCDPGFHYYPDPEGMQLTDPKQRSHIENLAADMCVNSNLPKSDIKSLNGCLPEDIQCPDHRESEEYWQALMKLLKEAPPSKDGQGVSVKMTGQGDSQNQNQSEGKSQEKDASGGGRSGEKDSRDFFGIGRDQHGPMRGDCGSCADGIKRSYEKDGRAVERSKEDIDLLRRKTAQDIASHARSSSDGRGSIPAGLLAQVEKILRGPEIPWYEKLRTLVTRGIARSTGARVDFNEDVQRIRVRGGKTGRGSAYFEEMMGAPEPVVAVVVDTSGSVGDEELKVARFEVQTIAKQMGAIIQVYATDTESHKTDSRKMELRGRGGTDMRVGIDAALNGKPKPGVIVVLTDGLTPWPESKTKIPVVVGLVTDNPDAVKPPDWMQSLHIAPDKLRERKRTRDANARSR